MAEVILKGVSKAFGPNLALQDFTARFDDGAFIALLGPSGCGKSTLLRLLAGFEQPTQGQIHIGAQEVANGQNGKNLAPEKRNIGFVFQSHALWPHMNVRRNIGYPLELKKLPRAERDARIDAALRATALTDYSTRHPAELSGGQQQRVALGRCLVSDTVAVLLDEPLASLDAALRASLQEVFSDFHQRSGATMVYVTHDQAEAMALADKIAVMNAGRLVQFDRPERLYNQPRSRFVAEFVGEGRVVPLQDPQAARKDQKGGESWEASLLGVRVRLKTDPNCGPPRLACLRPENIQLDESGDLRALVRRSVYLGGRYRIELHSPDGTELITHSPDHQPPGRSLGLTFKSPWAFSDGKS